MKSDLISLKISTISIENREFANNNLTYIELTKNLVSIGSCAFYNNRLTNVEIPDSVITIGDYAFYNNKLENIEISKNIKILSPKVFCNNNIKNVLIPNGVISIGNKAFYNNKLTSVKIPDSVISIEENAFDNINIEYKNHLFLSDVIENIGCENIIKASKILDICSNFDLKNIDKKILEIIPINNDCIKGYMTNHKLFTKLSMDIGIKEYQDFYKICFILGLFNLKEQDKVIEVVISIYKKYDINDIHEMIKDIKIEKFNKKISKIILREWDHPKLKEIIKKLYNDYDLISKCIIEQRKETIGKKSKNKEEIEKLKLLKKEIMIDDIIEYIETHSFKINNGNEKLREIIIILKTYLNEKSFNQIQEIYEIARNVKEEIYSDIKEENGSIHYRWISKDDPINIILGYICNCCAKYGAIGEDIMIQSMINPCIKNLVIYGSANNIIGKATAYYNKEKEYLLFNNIEISKSFRESKKTTEEEKREVLNTILRGIYKQIEQMEKKGYKVNQIRIGMRENDLKKEILDFNIKIDHTDLLENYPYKNYDGDANDKREGQAVIKRKIA